MIIWISLAAVVVVIIIICLLALRFLRADDSDAFDELPDEPRRPARTPDTSRPHKPAAGADAPRRPSRPAPAGGSSWAGDRGGHPADDRVAAYRERGHDRQAAPDRRAGRGSGPGHPVPVGTRSAKSGRPAEANGHAKDWDSLSDVDYWAEVAADKPLTPSSAAAGNPAPTGRRGAEPRPDSRSAGRGEPMQNLPVRQRQPGTGRTPDFGGGQPSGPRSAPPPYRPAAGEPATESIAALARLGTRSPAGQRPAAQLPAPPLSQPRPASRPVPPAVLDDDPLTSPSFPAINAIDSRSYRPRRSDSQPRPTRPAPAYAEPARHLGGYPATDDRAASPPGGYPAQPSVPAGNPYGSFVSQPAANHSQQAPAIAGRPDGSDGGYSGNGQNGAGSGWYSGQLPNGAGHGQPGAALNQQTGYQPGYYPGYQGGQGETAAYAQPAYPGSQYDQRGYGSQENGYNRDGYQGYPGHGTSGY